jgi:hypothetical protein
MWNVNDLRGTDGNANEWDGMAGSTECTNQGTNGATSTVTFSVANAQTLFSNPADSAFSQLAGPIPGQTNPRKPLTPRQ